MSRGPRTALFLGVAASLLVGCAGGPTERRLTIVHTNDLHGHVERAAAVAAAAREQRDHNPSTLFLDAGDCITGTPISTVYEGRPVFEIMSLMGYDAAALGNHEFDHGWQRIADFRDLAAFPLLCANAADPRGRPLGDAPYRVFDAGGVRVGVLGLVTDDVPGLTTRAASEGCTFENPVDAARRLLPELRRECDVVVALTHLGVDDDIALAEAVPGIDLIVGGHSHTKLSTREQRLQVGGTDIVQAWCYGKQVGIVDLVWDVASRRVVSVSNRYVDVDPDVLPNHPEVAELVGQWLERTEAPLREVIGSTPEPLDRERLRAAIEAVYREVLDADFGFQNLGGVRDELAAGDIRVKDLWTVLPFENTVVRVRLRGRQLPRWCRDRLGAALQLDREYVVATNSFVADQQAQYFGTQGAPVEQTGVGMRDAVVKWVREHGGFVPAGGSLPPGRHVEGEIR